MHVPDRRFAGLLVGIILAALVLLPSFAGPAVRVSGDHTAAQSPAEIAYFRFDYPPYPETFVFQLNDPAKIAQARQILQGDQSTPHVLGTIVKEPVPYNAPWRYHLEPETIEFFHSAIEVCDANISYVEAHLDEVCGAFLPGCEWCPWGSRLLEEVTLPPSSVHLYLPLIHK
ncbi:MAG: calmodulin-binding protein [Anaerolineae bacterium]|nr:calmodulin-binding protein [Anaerolineae bacterium]